MLLIYAESKGCVVSLKGPTTNIFLPKMPIFIFTIYTELQDHLMIAHKTADVTEHTF